ncbi:MAG: hypothetical protein AAFU57_13625 [Bacteroidota bacterium]
MPANRKYLSTSPLTKCNRLTAGLLGSFLASLAFHLALTAWLELDIVLTISIFSFFIVWIGLMLIAYWIRKVWQVWALILMITLVSLGAIYLAMPF